MSIEKYRKNFLKEVEERVEEGQWVKMCMQCGVCAGSCPFGPHWEHTPQKIFMMIRAGKREEVLTSDSMWMCTSCYNCVVRCPRKLPITHIMHGLAYLSKREGLMPKNQPTAQFGQLFWDNLTKNGRVNELKLSLGMYFKDGFSQGIKNAMAMQSVGMGMMKAKRLNPMEILGGHGIKDKSGFSAMLKKAKELEDARRKLA
ncbi:MAG: 4Fe-4S dicluster domain-containing protein [Sulfuricella sp.]|jgi:quinone-modifying oxidoreductase subunit QmoC|nr:4Fe-4S dicluster domain-containing protein [Sulfuricella sp.]